MHSFKRAFLLFVSILISVYFGFFFFDTITATEFIGRWGYWVLFTAWVLLLANLWTLVRHSFPSENSILKFLRFYLFRPRKCIPLVYVLVVWWIMVSSQPWQFKIVMDEPVLAATSLQMHLEKEAFCYISGYEVENVYYPYLGGVDKRPLFFPFLLSLLHDLTGYDPYQGIYLNLAVAFALLVLVYRMGRLIAPPLGGYIAVLLLATSPLLTMNATSGGFDLLNLFMILCVAWAGFSFIRCPEDYRLNVLVLLAVLLAQTRYESVLYIFPVVICILMVWWKSRSIRLTKTLLVVPLLMLIYPLQRQLMYADDRYWEMRSADQVPFALEYITGNWSRAIHFFLSTSDRIPNSILITLLFVLALTGFLYACLRQRIKPDISRQKVCAFAGFGAAVMVNLFLLMAYHWGQIDDMAAARLVLPFILLQVVVILLALRYIGKRSSIQMGLLSLAGFFFWAYTLPLSARTNFLPWSIEGAQVEYLLDLAQSMEVKDSLVISNLHLASRIGQQSCVDIGIALKQLDKLRMQKELKFFREMYVVYLVPTSMAILESNETIKSIEALREKIEASFELEHVYVEKLNDGVYLHRSRIIKVHGPAPDLNTSLLGANSSISNVGKVELSDEAIQRFMESLPR